MDWVDRVSFRTSILLAIDSCCRREDEVLAFIKSFHTLEQVQATHQVVLVVQDGVARRFWYTLLCCEVDYRRDWFTSGP